MKFFNHIVLLFAILLSIPTQAESLHHSTEKALFDHLTEVNQQWKYQYDLSAFDFRQIVDFDNDNQRIQTHLQFVYQLLSNRSTTHLNKIQIENRQRHLAVLKSYYEAAIFPTNHYHTKRQPYFVDNFDVHCAVGYLLQQDGQNELVSTIRKNDNYAYIHELTKYSQIEIWAKANGFTVDELALIQPGYTPTNEFSPVGNGSGVDGEILCFAKSDDGETLFIGGDFDYIYGIYSPAIGSFDGSSFTGIGTGIHGKITDLLYHDDKLYAVGDFTLLQFPTSVAVWDGTTWTALQFGDMQGTVNAIEIIGNRLYIGGDFQYVNNIPMPYLAYYDIFTNQWSNHGYTNSSLIPNGFSVDTTVYDLQRFDNKLLVGGAFTEVAPSISDTSYTKFTTSHLAYWNGYEWSLGFNTQNGIVHSIKHLDGRLCLGSTVGNNNNTFSSLLAGFWSYGSWYHHFEDNIIHDFLSFNNSIYAVGGIQRSTLGGVGGRGIVKLNNFGNVISIEGAGFTNGSVKAAIEFKGKAYFGGDFDTIGYSNLIEVNGLTVSEMDLPTSTQTINTENNTKVWYANSTVIIKKENYESSDFTLFNINGQIIHQVQNINTNRHEIPISHLPKGVYFYKVNSENGTMSGKLAVY